MTSSHYFNCFCQQIRLSRGAQKGGDSAYLASTHLATRMAQFCALSLAVSDFLDRKPLRTTAFQSAPGLLDAMSAVVPANAIEGNESTKRRRSTGYIDELGADLRKKKENVQSPALCVGRGWSFRDQLISASTNPTMTAAVWDSSRRRCQLWLLHSNV